MPIGSKLKIEKKGMFAASLFYVIVGVVLLVLLPLTGFPPHVALMGLFSLIVAYSMFVKRGWTIWLVVIMFFVANTFSVYMLYYYVSNDYLLASVTIVYLIFTWIATAYVAAKRKSFES